MKLYIYIYVIKAAIASHDTFITLGFNRNQTLDAVGVINPIPALQPDPRWN